MDIDLRREEKDNSRVEFQRRSSMFSPSLSVEAYDKLHRMIISGQIQPGQWFKKRALAQQMNMSPTPVVEAIRRLQHDGLVESFPRLGYRLRTWTADELEEIYEIRAALEGLAARQCSRRMSDEKIADLRPLAEKLDQADAAHSATRKATALMIAWGEPHSDEVLFHRTLAEASGRRLLVREIERLHLWRATLCLKVQPLMPMTITHTRLLDAIAARDADLAENTTRGHVHEAGGWFVAQVRRQFGDGPVTFDHMPPAQAGGE